MRVVGKESAAAALSAKPPRRHGACYCLGPLFFARRLAAFAPAPGRSPAASVARRVVGQGDWPRAQSGHAARAAAKCMTLYARADHRAAHVTLPSPRTVSRGQAAVGLEVRVHRLARRRTLAAGRLAFRAIRMPATPSPPRCRWAAAHTRCRLLLVPRRLGRHVRGHALPGRPPPPRPAPGTRRPPGAPPPCAPCAAVPARASAAPCPASEPSLVTATPTTARLCGSQANCTL